MAGALAGRYRLACRQFSATAFTPAFFSPRSWEFFARVFGSPSGRRNCTARIFSPKLKRRIGAGSPDLLRMTTKTDGDMTAPSCWKGSVPSSVSRAILKSRRRMRASRGISERFLDGANHDRGRGGIRARDRGANQFTPHALRDGMAARLAQTMGLEISAGR